MPPTPRWCCRRMCASDNHHVWSAVHRGPSHATTASRNSPFAPTLSQTCFPLRQTFKRAAKFSPLTAPPQLGQFSCQLPDAAPVSPPPDMAPPPSLRLRRRHARRTVIRKWATAAATTTLKRLGVDRVPSSSFQRSVGREVGRRAHTADSDAPLSC